MKTTCAILFLLCVSFTLVASQTTFVTLATAHQVSNPITPLPLSTVSAYGEFVYYPNGTFTYNIFLDGVTLDPLLVSMEVHAGGPKTDGPLLFSLNVGQGSANVLIGSTGVVDASLFPTLSSAVLSSSLYLLITTYQGDIRGDFQLKKLGWSSDLKTSNNQTGNVFLYVTGSPGAYQLTFFVNFFNLQTLPDQLNLVNASNTLLLPIGLAGDSLPISGTRAVSDVAIQAIITGASQIALGASTFLVSKRSITTLSIPLSTQDTPSYVPPGPTGSGLFVYNWATDIFTFTFSFSGLSSTPSFYVTLTKTQDAGTFDDPIAPLDYLTTSTTNSSISGIGILLGPLKCQVLLGLAKGTISITAVTPKYPLGELKGYPTYGQLRITAIPICRGGWFLTNENSIPLQFSLSRSESPSYNGNVLLPYQFGMFLVDQTNTITFRIGDLEDSATNTKIFQGRRNRQKCLVAKNVCRGKWNVFSNVPVTFPIQFSYTIMNTTTGFEIQSGVMWVGGTANFQPINSPMGDGPDQQLLVFLEDKTEVSLMTALKRCP